MMQKLTKIEVGWLADLLEREAESLREDLECAGECAAFINLKVEQYKSLEDRLRRALEANSKRIEITY